MVQRIFKILFIGVFAIHTAGCAAAVVGTAAAAAGTGVWAYGRLHKDIDASLTQVYEATLKALAELELEPTEDRKDRLTARIRTEFADGANVWIDLDAITANATKMVIRVGVMGDRGRSQQILEKTEDNLKK
ncbi:MAG: DUF3568 family protein [Candidatus Omnitrophica bacterium]|nr:DUF3568 family protein [Candidatus Omnitrophota bacterium]